MILVPFQGASPSILLYFTRKGWAGFSQHSDRTVGKATGDGGAVATAHGQSGIDQEYARYRVNTAQVFAFILASQKVMEEFGSVGDCSVPSLV